MNIVSIEQNPIATMGYYRVRKGNLGRERVDWPFYAVYVDRLPKGCTALVASSDMQGIETLRRKGKWGKLGTRLVGHAVAEYTAEVLQGQGKDPKQAGVLLAGDLHSDPLLLRRGGHGDVREVWLTFRDHFKWVVGVAGNHDVFGQDGDLERFQQMPGINLLNGRVVQKADWRIGGVSGVLGTNPAKPWRQGPDLFKSLVQKVLQTRPQIMLLHEGPSLIEKELQGRDVIRDYIEECPPSFVICGHRHWLGNRVEKLTNGTRVMNVEGKTVLLMEEARVTQY